MGPLEHRQACPHAVTEQCRTSPEDGPHGDWEVVQLHDAIMHFAKWRIPFCKCTDTRNNEQCKSSSGMTHKEFWQVGKTILATLWLQISLCHTLGWHLDWSQGKTILIWLHQTVCAGRGRCKGLSADAWTLLKFYRLAKIGRIHKELSRMSPKLC